MKAEKPYLFAPDAELKDDLENGSFRSSALGRQGEVAALKSAASFQPLFRLPPTRVPERLDALAAEYLLAPDSSAAKAQLKKYLKDYLPASEIYPCGRNKGFPTLQETLQKIVPGKAACALYPLASRKGNPSLGLVWSFQGCQRTWRNEPPGIPVEGNSYQAAEALARMAAERDNGETRLRLASDYIITAELKGRELVDVDFGNKPLALNASSKRIWIIAGGGTDKFRKAEARFHVVENATLETYETIDEAFEKIAGDPIRTAKPQKWPRHLRAIHLLVGGSSKAGISSVFFSQAKEVYLWHSTSQKASIEPAERIRKVLRKRGWLKQDIHLRPLPSGDAATAEQRLMRELPEDEDVVFNVTSGNRMMMFAVASVAHKRKKMQMIYRDVDTEGISFTSISYRHGLAETASLTATPPGGTDAWKKFLAPSHEEETVASLLEALPKAKRTCKKRKTF